MNAEPFPRSYGSLRGIHKLPFSHRKARSEAMDAIELAKVSGYTTVISHRSGETEEDFIADLAVAPAISIPLDFTIGSGLCQEIYCGNHLVCNRLVASSCMQSSYVQSSCVQSSFGKTLPYGPGCEV